MSRSRAGGGPAVVRPGRARRPGGAAAAAAALCIAALWTGQARAQQGALATYHVQGNVHMLVGAGANVAVQTGEEGVLVVDTGNTERGADVLGAIRRLTDKPIRWIVNTHSHRDHTGANETISQAGMTVNGNPAAVVAHEGTLTRMAAEDRPVTELPLNSFFEQRRDFFFNGEAILLEHVPNAHTDGDILVYFRDSDVLVAGDVFVTTHYPDIDRDAGGSVDGFVEGLNRMLDITVPAHLQEAGTYVVPGHGRVGDEADVLEYRDMVLILRDRIAHMIESGMTLEEIIATEPTLDYDSRYGSGDGPGSTAHFIETVYGDLTSSERGSAQASED